MIIDLLKAKILQESDHPATELSIRGPLGLWSSKYIVHP